MIFGLIVIGDELLSGKRQDKHFLQAIDVLGRRGLEPSYCHILGDDQRRIVTTLRQTLNDGDTLFCFGGIGATPDDVTRTAVALAADVELVRHPGAVTEIESRFGEQAYPNRIRMADLPAGCELIPNPVNRVPGFSLRDHHFLPGFPQMAWPMMEWVLDHHYTSHFRTRASEHLLLLRDISESMILDLMEAFVARFPALRFSSLPHIEGNARRIEIGIKGGEEEVREGVAYFTAALDKRGVHWQDKP